MEIFYNIILIILLIIYSTEDNKNTVKVIATSGIIEKTKYSKAKLLSFTIQCQVDQNITNKISLIDIGINTKRPEDNKIFPSICNLAAIRIDSEEDEYGDTQLNCILNYTEFNNDNVDDDMNLIIDENPTYTSSVADFDFINFDKIGIPIEIGGLHIYYLDEDYCQENHFLFEMNFTNNYNPPLESTVCEFNINGNDVHDIAQCAIPLSSNVIKCYIDISEDKMEQGEKIEIKAQTLARCQNGQMVNIINDAQNILTIEEDCEQDFFLIYKWLYMFLIFLIF